jgi:hypothetical protein
MAFDEVFASSGQDPDAIRAEAEARRKISMDRAMQELPQQIAGIPIYRQPGRDLLTKSITADLVTPAMIRNELEGLGPGHSPEIAASWIEGDYGTLQEQPSWANADQWASAGARWAQARDDGGMASPLTSTLADEYHKSQHLMSPARAEYMQGPGRRVDVLRNLRKDPERAMHFWDRSAPPEVRDGKPSELALTRTEYYDPIYQRFGEDNVSPYLVSSSPIARGLSYMSALPYALQFRAAETPTSSEAFDRSDTTILSQDRTRSGANQENPIADATSDATPQQIIDRQNELDQRAVHLLPPPGQNVANSVLESLYSVIPHVSASAWADRPLQPGEESRGDPPKASGLVRDGIVLGTNYLDGSQVMGVFNPKALLPELVRDAGREAAIETGLTAAISQALPEDPVAYATQGLPSLPMDMDARRQAFEAEKADMAARPQSLYDARNANDPEFGRAMRVMGSGLLDWLRSSTPSASAFGGQPTQR